MGNRQRANAAILLQRLSEQSAKGSLRTMRFISIWMQLSLSFNCTIRLNFEQTENKENENDTVYARNANMRMRVIHRIGGMGCACAKFKNDDFLNFFCFEKGHAPTIGNFSLEFIEAVIVLFFFFFISSTSIPIFFRCHATLYYSKFCIISFCHLHSQSMNEPSVIFMEYVRTCKPGFEFDENPFSVCEKSIWLEIRPNIQLQIEGSNG